MQTYAHPASIPPRFGSSLVFEPPVPSVREVAVVELLHAETLRSHVNAHARTVGAREPAVAASMWSKHHVARVVPAVLATLALHRQGLDAHPSNASVHIHGDVPIALRLHNSAPHTGNDVVTWTLQRLFADHIEPLFDLLHDISGVSTRVLWGNAGNHCAWLYDALVQEFPDQPNIADDRAQLLKSAEATWHAGAPNPMRHPVRYETVDLRGCPKRVHVRKTCCLRDRVPENAACYSCPRLTDDERVRILLDLEART